MTDVRLNQIPAGDERKLCVALLLLADGSERQARACPNEGDLYVYREGAQAIGVVL